MSDATKCSWQGRCKDDAVGHVQFNGREHPLCAEDMKPERHPLDLRKKLVSWDNPMKRDSAHEQGS